jgi:hypothetical protein
LNAVFSFLILYKPHLFFFLKQNTHVPQDKIGVVNIIFIKKPSRRHPSIVCEACWTVTEAECGDIHGATLDFMKQL